MVTIALMLSVMINSFAWGDFFIGINLLMSFPFVVAGIVILKNIKHPNERTIQNTLIAVFLILWLPSIGLPFFYEVGGLVICLAILGIGLYGIFGIKKPLPKMMLINSVGLFFLLLNLWLVLGIL